MHRFIAFLLHPEFEPDVRIDHDPDHRQLSSNANVEVHRVPPDPGVGASNQE
jgi:hypothetical protein